MKKIRISLLFITLLSSIQALSFGQTGHRVSGAIAEYYLTDEAKIAINKLLINEDLAEASTFADEMRSNSSKFWKKTATPWHYVNIHQGKKYNDDEAPPEGNAVTALAMFSKQIKSSETSLQDKQTALRFIVHIIGDLHQPFHTGTDVDEGGNRIKVIFFSEESNLHAIWDSGLIDRQQLSYTEWTNKLQRKISTQQAQEWMEIDPKVWVNESAILRAGLYPKPYEALSWDYQYQNLPIIKQRLQMSGVRMAAYLNDLFKDTSK